MMKLKISKQQIKIKLSKLISKFLCMLNFLSNQIVKLNSYSDSLIPKNTLKNYISSIFGETFCLWFISNLLLISGFYQLKSYINFKQFENISEKFKNISLRECHLVSFFLYDDNGDGFLCPRDLFAIFQRQISPKIDQDILKIGEFIKNHVGI